MRPQIRRAFPPPALTMLARSLLAIVLGLEMGGAGVLAAPAVPQPAARPSPAHVIVICAPGYPGNTVQAQPTMDLFASAVEKEAGWTSGRLGAAYFETEPGGIDRIAARDAALALVPLPFFLQHAQHLDLRAKLLVEQDSGSKELWSLVARRGAISSAASLAGWEITGMPGYAPDFVRGPLLGEWGPPPPTARITFGAGALGALRRAASGEKLAVIVDGAQASALEKLPFAKDLEIVVRSRPLPGSVLCAIDERLGDAETSGLLEALRSLSRRPEGAAVLKTMRMKRFVPVDGRELDAARRAFERARSVPAR